MASLIGLLLVPIVVGGVAFVVWHHTITWREFGLQLFVTLALLVGCWAFAWHRSTQAIEHFGGRVVDKRSGTQACCHCESDCQRRNRNGVCVRSRQRCSHAHDYWWSLSISTSTSGEANVQLGEECLDAPYHSAGWSRVGVGDPVVVPHEYTDYLAGDRNSLVRRQGTTAQVEPYLDRIPPFPRIHDELFVQEVVADGVVIPHGWQREIAEINADLGPRKQVDLTVLLTSADDPNYALAVESVWGLQPKNALHLILGAPDGRTIAWARVVTLSNVELLEVSLREGLEGRQLDDPTLLSFVRQELDAKFERTPMAEFAYLAGAAAPSGAWLIGLYSLALVLSLGLSWLMHRLDVSRAGVRRGLRGAGRAGIRWAFGRPERSALRDLRSRRLEAGRLRRMLRWLWNRIH